MRTCGINLKRRTTGEILEFTAVIFSFEDDPSVNAFSVEWGIEGDTSGQEEIAHGFTEAEEQDIIDQISQRLQEGDDD